MNTPIEKWYWPENTIKEDEEDDIESDDDESSAKKMKILSYEEVNFYFNKEI